MKKQTKRVVSILLTLLMLIGLVPMAAFSASAESDYKYQANSWYALEMYLKAAGNITITITGDITNTHDMGSEGHKTLEVYGNKIINLNGHKIECVDKTSNAIVGGEVVTVESEKTMFHVDGSSSLTINDSKGGGEIAFKGDHLKESKNYFHYAKRDVFSVDGTLVVNAGKITAGSQGKEYIYKGEEIESVWGSLYSDWSGNAQQVTWGTAANVNEGGKLIVNGGELYGRGIHVYQNTKTNKAVMGQRDEVVYIAEGGTASVNGGSFIALEGANVFAGDGVTDGLKVRDGKFELKKPSTIRFIYDKELYAEHYNDWGLAELVNASSIGSFNVPQSAYSQVYDKLIVKYDGKEYKGFYEIKDLSFDKENYRKDLSVEFIPNNDKSIKDAEHELHYGTKVYDNAQTQYEYFADSADKLKLYCNFEEEYYLDFDGEIIYVWSIWVDDNTGDVDHEFFTYENYINPLVFSNVDLTGKTIFVSADAYELGPDNAAVNHYTKTFKLYPTEKPMGFLEFTDQNPQMEAGENTCNMEGGYTGYSYGYQFNHKPLPQELIDAGYSVERVYSIQDAGGYIISPTKDNGTGIVKFSNIYTEAGIYTLRMSLRLVKDGETVDSISNVYNLFVYENVDTNPLTVIFTEDSKAQAGSKLTVDLEAMAELDEDFMEAYFNDDIIFKWFYDGLLQGVSKSPTYEIDPGMVGHYVGVKVCYGDKSVSSEEFMITKPSNPLYFENPDWGNSEEDIIKAVEYTLNEDGTYTATVIVDVDCVDGQLYYYEVESMGYWCFDTDNNLDYGLAYYPMEKPAKDEYRVVVAKNLEPDKEWRVKIYLADDQYADYELQGYDFSWVTLNTPSLPNSEITGLLGDANEDSTVNIKDATAIQKHIAGLITLTERGLLLADVDRNNNVNIKDATAIQKYIASIPTGTAVGLNIQDLKG